MGCHTVSLLPAVRCIAHPGLALATHVCPTRADGTVDGADLAVADLTGEVGLQGAVGTAGATAQAVVVEFDEVGDTGQNGAHRQVFTLHVAEVARVLTTTGTARRSISGSRSRWAATNWWMSRTLAENARASSESRRWPGPLHRGAAPCRVHEDRGVTGHRGHDAARERPRVVPHPRVGVQRAENSRHPPRARRT